MKEGKRFILQEEGGRRIEKEAGGTYRREAISRGERREKRKGKGKGKLKSEISDLIADNDDVFWCAASCNGRCGCSWS